MKDSIINASSSDLIGLHSLLRWRNPFLRQKHPLQRFNYSWW